MAQWVIWSVQEAQGELQRVGVGSWRKVRGGGGPSQGDHLIQSGAKRIKQAAGELGKRKPDEGMVR